MEMVQLAKKACGERISHFAGDKTSALAGDSQEQRPHAADAECSHRFWPSLGLLSSFWTNDPLDQ